MVYLYYCVQYIGYLAYDLYTVFPKKEAITKTLVEKAIGKNLLNT